MRDYQKYINALRKCAKEHENDSTFTGHIIVSDLCRDTANLLEELEQEPFINKLCISSEVCEHDKNKVLDRIKEDFIARYPRNYANELELGGRSCVFSLNDILHTIDKYNAKSEDK